MKPIRFPRRTFLQSSGAAAVATTIAGCVSPPSQHGLATPDVCIYGATPAGIAAAIAAGRAGHSVVLIEPTHRLGGLVTCGLSHTDFRTFEGLTGTFLNFTRRVEAHYLSRHGANSPQVQDSFRGTFGEPGVNLTVFEAMLAEVPAVRIWRTLLLDAAETKPGPGGLRITRTSFRGTDGREVRVAAKVYIDASYEGDLMAAAGVKYRVGREARSEYGESLAPEPNSNWIPTVLL